MAGGRKGKWGRMGEILDEEKPGDKAQRPYLLSSAALNRLNR
jgi:hypothetical protein